MTPMETVTRRARLHAEMRRLMAGCDEWTTEHHDPDAGRVAWCAVVDVGARKVLAFSCVHPLTVGTFNDSWREAAKRTGYEMPDVYDIHFGRVPDSDVSGRMCRMVQNFSMCGASLPDFLEDRRRLYAFTQRGTAVSR